MKLYSKLTVILHLIIHDKLHHIFHAYLLGTIVPNYLVPKYQMLRNVNISELSQTITSKGTVVVQICNNVKK